MAAVAGESPACARACPGGAGELPCVGKCRRALMRQLRRALASRTCYVVVSQPLIVSSFPSKLATASEPSECSAFVERLCTFLYVAGGKLAFAAILDLQLKAAKRDGQLCTKLICCGGKLISCCFWMKNCRAMNSKEGTCSSTKVTKRNKQPSENISHTYGRPNVQAVLCSTIEIQMYRDTNV